MDYITLRTLLLKFERRLEHGFIVFALGRWVSRGLFLSMILRQVGKGHCGWCCRIMVQVLWGYFGLCQDSIRVVISCPLGGLSDILGHILSLKACPYRFESVSVACRSSVRLDLSGRRSLLAPTPILFRRFGGLSCPILNRCQSAIDSGLTVAELQLLLLIWVVFGSGRDLNGSLLRAWSLKGSPVRSRISSRVLLLSDYGHLFVPPFRLIASFEVGVLPSTGCGFWHDYIDTWGEKDDVVLVLSGWYESLVDLLHLLVILLEFESVRPIVLMPVVQQSLV